MKTTLKKMLIGYSNKQDRTFFFLLWLSTFCSGIIYVMGHPLIGWITIAGYSYVWWRWMENKVWFLE